jgi:predicted peptidase
MRWDSPGMAEAVVGMIDEIVKKYRIDPDRVYLSGLSMGGKGTWLVAEAAPDRFAAIAPIAAVAVRPERAGDLLKYLPMWIICGSDDGGFTDGSKQMAQVIKSSGGNVQLTVFPQEGHGVWARYYPEPKFYDWLLKHTRTSTQAAKSAAATQPSK